MARVRVSLLTFGIGFLLHTTPASAQPASHPPGLQPVSPGSFGTATSAPPCPSFSWALTPRAVGYELVVHRLTDQGQLDGVPVLRAIVPGTAAAWTPANTECLSNAEYMWFIREVGKATEPASGWSEGMRFSVASLPSVESTGSSKTETVTPSQSQRPGGPPPTNQEILNRLNDVLTILNEPEPVFSFVLCTEPALQGEVELGSRVELDGTIEGRVGAEGFGNGAMIRLKGKPVAKLDGKIKGAWDILKLGVCWDIGATVRNRRAQSAGSPSAPSMRAAATGDLGDVIAGLDLAALQQKLQAFADRLQIDPTRFLGTLESLGDISFDGNPFGILGEDGILRQIAQSVPLPEKVRALAQNPASLFDKLHDLRTQGICNIDLPPALSGPISQICQLVAGEPFRPLLNRVHGAITTIEGVVNDIKGALPSADDCKFFCGK